MRTIKLFVLCVLAMVLVALGVANMALVDLYLMPPSLFGDRFGVRGVPLAAVILAAVLLGIVIGQVLEWMRERKHRVTADAKRREIVQLRQEVTKLRARTGGGVQDLPRIPAP